MLESRTTRLGWASAAFGVVGNHDPPEDVGQVSFQAAHGRAWGCSGGDPPYPEGLTALMLTRV